MVRNGEKRQFQVRLPQNTKKIVGIKITATPQIRQYKNRLPNRPQEVGWLWLRIPGKTHVFFAATVVRPLPLHNQTIHHHRPADDFEHGTYWTQGTKEEFFQLSVPLTTNIIEGYYIDQLTTGEEKYSLRIYLTLEE